jgi:iron(III) transport system substrate-binding protein
VQGHDALNVDRRGFLKVAGAVATAAAAGAAVASCSSNSANASSQGSGGGSTAKPVPGSTITIYTAANVDVMKLLTTQFEKDTGVKANVYRDSSGLVAQRFLKEQQANQHVCDVLDIGDLQFMKDMGGRGYLADISDYPGVSDIPSDWKSLPYYVLENQQAQTCSYNTDLVKGDLIPKSWADLTRPEFKGKIAMADPRNNVDTTGAFLLGIVSKFGFDWLAAMGKQNIQFSPSAPPALAKVASGDAMISLPTLAQNVVTYAEKNAPVQIVSPPLAPTTATPRAVAIPKTSSNPAAARAWTAYVLGVEGQTTMNVYKDVSIGVSPLGADKVQGSVAAFTPGEIYTPGPDDAQKQINKIADLLNIH